MTSAWSQDNRREDDMLSLHPACKPQIQPFVGRLGGNQKFVLDRTDPDNAGALMEVPDAAPLMDWKDSLRLSGFKRWSLWKLSGIECIGTMMLAFITIWASARAVPLSDGVSASPEVAPAPAILDPLIGGIFNWLFLTLFTFTFSPVSGSHLNPTITLATFFARLISLPRMVLYIGAQILGAALAGWILRFTWGSNDIVVGGCSIDMKLISVSEAFVLEFIFCLILVFLAFGVGLDPRQLSVYGAALSPWLVGLILGLLSWASAVPRQGYGGACEFVVKSGTYQTTLANFFSLEPCTMLRCICCYRLSYLSLAALGEFGALEMILIILIKIITNHLFQIGALAASISHGLIYYLLPPWTIKV
ncbi:putative MIP transporter [Aspergillus clavatus NRRL 1]|uniref:MIP transporter, putative n=1 Tax=Aspergillus clavatus (strain ATCC 1007 / CBS 513.65 / DSM 816 / NCTC 3887 / NRRL 1 / QM 1276 / 107) TaxID=344612 RepID=A1CGN7_ASPCL|nr:MIP transporter, putative [Aspergillus clavatus NRRL 1]EAW11117.1 MIP transporter, putative [Aspergillus clavatus NRRL 1]